MKRTILVPALLLLSGCTSSSQQITCLFKEWSISCDRTDIVQDSPSSSNGAEDEKPVGAFQKPLSGPEEVSP